MASLAEALLEGALGAAQGGAATAIERAKTARDEAFTREGWGRQEKRDEGERAFRAEENELNREAQNERSKLDRESRERASAARTKTSSSSSAGGKMNIKELADGRVIATQGGTSFMLNEQSKWVPIGLGSEDQSAVDSVSVDPEDTEEGWFDAIISGSKSLSNKLFGKDETEAPTMAGEASKAPIANYESTKAQLTKTLEEEGFGAFDSAIRESGLNPIQQIQLMGSIGLDKIPEMPDIPVNYSQASQSPQAILKILEGSGVNVSDYQKVKQQYPDKSDDIIIRSIQEHYNQQ